MRLGRWANSIHTHAQMNKAFVPASKPARYPVGPDGRSVSQVEFYERLTDGRCDLRDVAYVVEPVIMSAQMKPVELCDLLSNDN